MLRALAEKGARQWNLCSLPHHQEKSGYQEITPIRVPGPEKKTKQLL